MDKNKRLATVFIAAVEDAVKDLLDTDAYRAMNVSVERDDRGQFPSLTIRPMVGVRKKVKVR